MLRSNRAKKICTSVLLGIFAFFLIPATAAAAEVEQGGNCTHSIWSWSLYGSINEDGSTAKRTWFGNGKEYTIISFGDEDCVWHNEGGLSGIGGDGWVLEARGDGAGDAYGGNTGTGITGGQAPVVAQPLNTENIEELGNGFAWYALAAAVTGIFISAALWALGSKGQNPGQELTGKRGIAVCLAAAFAVGALNPVMTQLESMANSIDTSAVSTRVPTVDTPTEQACRERNPNIPQEDCTDEANQLPGTATPTSPAAPTNAGGGTSGGLYDAPVPQSSGGGQGSNRAE